MKAYLTEMSRIINFAKWIQLESDTIDVSNIPYSEICIIAMLWYSILSHIAQPTDCSGAPTPYSLHAVLACICSLCIVPSLCGELCKPSVKGSPSVYCGSMALGVPTPLCVRYEKR